MSTMQKFQSPHSKGGVTRKCQLHSVLADTTGVAHYKDGVCDWGSMIPSNNNLNMPSGRNGAATLAIFTANVGIIEIIDTTLSDAFEKLCGMPWNLSRLQHLLVDRLPGGTRGHRNPQT